MSGSTPRIIFSSSWAAFIQAYDVGELKWHRRAATVPRSKMNWWTIAGAVPLIVVSALNLMAVAQTGTSVRAGVFTVEQAKRRATVYANNCAFCHGDTLEGS